MIKRLIFNNFWLKVISLIIAIITWFYASQELKKERYMSSSFYSNTYTQHTKNPPDSSTEKKSMNKGYVVENR